MVESEFEKNRLVLDFSEKELKELELPAGSNFELVKARKGVWVLLEAPKKSTPEIDEAERKIIGLLRKKSLKERVEGKFEKLLSPAEQIKFKKMFAQNKVERFKLNEKYKKAIYRIPPRDNQKKFNLQEKTIEDYSLEKDGFVVAKTEFKAAQLSQKLSDKIKSGEVKGTRVFSGEFFIIDSNLFDQRSKPVLEFLKTKKNATLAELNTALKMPSTLIKIICAFLAEDGVILERRKEQFQFID